MIEQELQQYIRTNYPKEDDACDWKETKVGHLLGQLRRAEKIYVGEKKLWHLK